jgi:hypothetical protein
MCDVVRRAKQRLMVERTLVPRPNVLGCAGGVLAAELESHS